MDRRHPPRLTNDEFIPESGIPVQVYRDTYPGAVSLHWHEFYELSYVVSGRGEQRLNGRWLPLSPGTLFLLTPSDFHELRSADNHPLEIYNVIFTEYFIDDEIYPWLFSQGDLLQTQIPSHTQPVVQSDYDRLREERTCWRVGSMLMVKATLQRLFIDLARRVPNTVTAQSSELLSEASVSKNTSIQDVSSPLSSNLQKALVYIHHHFRENLNLETVARQAQYSPTYFSDVFSRSIGQTFQKYLQNLRIEFASSLLMTSKLPVTEIGYAAGFHTLGHFERVFRERRGVTPLHYRKLALTSKDMQHIP